MGHYDQSKCVIEAMFHFKNKYFKFFGISLKIIISHAASQFSACLNDVMIRILVSCSDKVCHNPSRSYSGTLTHTQSSARTMIREPDYHLGYYTAWECRIFPLLYTYLSAFYTPFFSKNIITHSNVFWTTERLLRKYKDIF